MQGGSMTRIKQILKLALKLPPVATARALSGTNRSARFTGAYPTQAAALAATVTGQPIRSSASKIRKIATRLPYSRIE